MKRFLLQSLCPSALGITSCWLVLSLTGLPQFVNHLEQRWDLPNYQAIFIGFLTCFLLCYFSTKEPFTYWIKDAVFGAVAGSLAGLLSLLVVGWLRYGIGSFYEGYVKSGFPYLLVVLGANVFPFCSWLFGLLATLLGGFVRKQLSRYSIGRQ